MWQSSTSNITEIFRANKKNHKKYPPQQVNNLIKKYAKTDASVKSKQIMNKDLIVGKHVYGLSRLDRDTYIFSTAL